MGGSSVYFRSTLGASDGARSPSDVAWSPPGALNPLDPACASPPRPRLGESWQAHPGEVCVMPQGGLHT